METIEIETEAQFERALAEANAYCARLSYGEQDDGWYDELCERIVAYENLHYAMPGLSTVPR